ncbi:MAG: S1 family peptidase [Actinoplanes sp.]
MRRILLHTACAIGLTAAAVMAATGTAVAAPASIPEYEAQVAAYLKTYPELTRAEAEDRVTGQPARAALLERLSTEQAESFGGSWFDARTGIQHLNVVGAAARSVTTLATGAGLRVEVHPATYTVDDLEARAEKIRADRTAARAGRVGVRVDPIGNRVVVAVTSTTAARAALGPAAADPAVVAAVAVPTDAGPEACHSRFNCSAPLRSGVALRLNGTNRCSVGFTARDEDGVRWAVTAGHCNVTVGDQWTHNTSYIGPIGDVWNAEDIDVARIRITNQPWISASGGWLYNEANPDSPTALDSAVTRNGQIQVGDSVCLQGFNSNAQHACGVIVPSTSDRGFVQVDFDGCPGDSGGGWYAPNGGNRTAYGIHHGGAQGCHSQFGFSWFSPLPALNAFWDRHSATTIRVETR